MNEERPEVRILVVEDSATQAEHLRFLLEERQYAVTVAGNGRQALAAIARQQPTLVISDVVMPEMDGYTLCRTIKADPALRHIPVLMVTSLAGIQDVAKSLECGADSFLRKPYEPRALLARIEYVLLNRELRQGRAAEAGMELMLEGQRHTIAAGREQIVDLLVSTYGEAVHMNEELQQQQLAIARSNQALAGLYRIAGELNRVSTEVEVCRQAVGAAMDMPRFRGGWIFLADADGNPHLAAAQDLPAPLRNPADAGDCPCWRQFMAGDPSLGTRLVDCDRLHGVVGAAAHATIPLRVDGRCLGVINLVAGAGESFDAEDLKMLDALGNQVAVALERARLYQHLEALVASRTAALRAEVEERRRAETRVASLNRIYAVLSGINSLIVRVHDRQDLFRDACRLAVEQGRFGLAWIGLLDRESFTLRPLALHAAWAGAPELAAGEMRGDNPLCEAMGERRALVRRDLAAGGDVPFAAAAAAQGLRALVALPLVAAGNPVGLMVLYAQDAAVFDLGELRLLEELAGDISFALEHIAQEERIDYLAYYDALTGLPNRKLLLDRLRQAVGLAQRQGRGMAVVSVNLDRFKIINDGMGHHVGDRLLQAVAERLGQCVREGDTVGRLGSDEFVLVCGDLGDGDLARIIDGIYSALEAPVVVSGDSLRVTASLGISLCPKDSDEPAALLKYADLALDQAKARGGHRHEFFTPDLKVRATERLHVENRLAKALDNGEFQVFYQPQVDAATGVINGMESLIRWRHPEFGIVAPGQFIPIAEEGGLIVRIGEWMLRQACRQARQWRDEGLCDFAVSVNLSMAQFREHSLFASLRAVLEETGLEPRFLELEVTESLVMDNPELFISFLRQVKDMGVQIAVDDFGTGYSSLNYLKRLPLDRLKVDYSFVRDITLDPGSASICRAVIAIAHNLHLGVVAEGVETEAQAVFLARHYCDTLQGHFLARASPADEITALLRRREPLLSPVGELAARRVLLLVDDEEPVRQALKRLLRPDGYHIITAAGAEEAFDLLARHHVGVVVAEQRLPGMAGSEFLGRVKDLHPRAIRIVLAGETDLKTVTGLVNRGQITKFLLKPWDEEGLRAALRDAFWQYELSGGMALEAA